MAEWPNCEPPIYRRADGKRRWLFVNYTDKWVVGSKMFKDMSSKSEACLSVSAKGRLPHEMGEKWEVQGSDQRLQVLVGKKAEIIAKLDGAFASMSEGRSRCWKDHWDQFSDRMKETRGSDSKGGVTTRRAEESHRVTTCRGLGWS